LKQQLEKTFDNRIFVTLHAAFERALIISPPEDGQGAFPDDEQDDQQVLIVFACPVHGDTHSASSCQSGQMMQADPLSQNFRRQPRVMDQA